MLIFLDNGTIDFKELNDFIDRKNLDSIGYFLINTRALSLLKTKSIIEKFINSFNFENFDRVKFYILYFD